MWILSEGYPCLGFTVWIKIYQVQKSRILGHDNVWSSLSVWHTTPQDWLENKPIASHFGFALRKLGLGTDHVIPVMSPFTKSSVYKMFSVYIMLKRKAGFFKFLAFEGRCRKAPFCDGLVWTVDLTVEIKLCFQIPLAYCGRRLKWRPIYDTGGGDNNYLSKKWFCRLHLVNKKMKLAIFHPQGVINSEP